MSTKENKTPWDEFRKAIRENWEQNFEIFPNTPDILVSESFNSHFLFVYGTLKRGFHNNYLLSQWRLIGKAFSQHPNFLMFKTPNMEKINGFPVAIHRNTVSKCSPIAARNFNTRFGRISGELYVNSQRNNVFSNLDTLEQNGKYYQRKVAPFVHYKTAGGKLIHEPSIFQAWYYDGMFENFEYTDKENRIRSILNPYPCYRGKDGVIYDWTG